MLYNVFLLIHVLVALSLVALVLLQQGRGAEAGAAFGGGASSTVFGAQGSASFLSRVTAMLATGFFVTSLFLGYFATQSITPSSILEQVDQQETMSVEESREPPVAETPDVPTVTTEEADTPASGETTSEDVPALPTGDESSSTVDTTDDTMSATDGGASEENAAEVASEESSAPADVPDLPVESEEESTVADESQ